MIFVLSAIRPDAYPSVLKKVYATMKSGSVLYFRDYGKYDLAEIRLAKRGDNKLSEDFYVKDNGTRCFYFTTECVSLLFTEAGFTELESRYHHRVVRNRKQKQ